MRKTLLLPVLAVAAMLADVLAAVSPAAAAAGPAKPAPGAAATSPGVATFIKSFVDTRRVNNSAFGHDVSPTSDGGYVVAGTAGLPGNGWVAKLSAAGQVAWQEQLGSGEAEFRSVQQTADGGYVVAGDTTSEAKCAANGFTSPACAWVVKLGPGGAVQWQRVYPGAHEAIATQVAQTPDGGYILAGREAFVPGLAGFAASWLAKTTATGALSWQHVFAGPTRSSLFDSVRLTRDGGYVAAGTNDDFAHSDNVWLVKTDAHGNVAGGRCTGQRNGATTEQPGPLTAATSSFPSVAPPANPPAATADTPVTTTLVTKTVC